MRIYVRDGVHEWHIHLYGLGDEIFDLAKHGEVVLGLDVLGVGGVETSDEASEGGDTDTFANTEDS